MLNELNQGSIAFPWVPGCLRLEYFFAAEYLRLDIFQTLILFQFSPFLHVEFSNTKKSR